MGEQVAAEADAEHELKLEQAEIASEPTTDVDETVADLRRRRADVARAADERGVQLAALATSPVAVRPTETPDERYARMVQHFGLVGRDQLSCGMHVHVAVGSRDEGVVAIDRLRGWLPLIVALTGNSPFWNGADSGYASYRRIAWGRFPTSGATSLFGTADEYDRRVEELVSMGAALDPAMIYFDARLSARYPTVEIRVADVVQDVEDSGAVAALCRALVSTAVAGVGDGDLDPSLVRAADWYAARYGLTGELCDIVERSLRPAADVLERLLEVVGAELHRAGDRERVHAFVSRRLDEGTGADLQRREFAARGRAADVVTAAARRTLA